MIAGSTKDIELKLDKHEKVTESGCWIWLGTTNADGYGVVAGSSHGVRWREGAHRVSYRHHVGPIPDGMHICHHCDVPACINPYHLYVGDPASNGYDKKRRKRARTKARFGKDNPMHGMTGAKNHFYGRKHSEESKRKISETKKRK